MSKWIHPKYNEQCKNNAPSSTSSTFIDSRKVPRGFWLTLFNDKCPKGLGQTSEKLANDNDLSCEDFLEQIGDSDEFNVERGLQNELPYQSISPVTDEDKAKSQDDLNGVCSEGKQVSNQECQGFKTPVLEKHKSSSCEVSTPYLFSPDLLSQGTQDDLCTPNDYHGTAYEHKSPGSQSLQATIPSLDNNGVNIIFQSSPDILDLMVAEKRPRSSLAFLSDGNSDDSIDEWSDSMATPPMHWSLSQGSAEDNNTDQQNQEKNVARTLFKGTSKEISQGLGMSGFSILDSCEEKLDKSHRVLTGKQLVEVSSFLHDDSLPKVINGSTLVNEQSISNKSNQEDYLPLQENQTVIKSDASEVANTSLNATLTMFPPTLPCNSPLSQETTLLSELAQSTPNASVSKSNRNIEESDKCRIKVKRNNSKNSMRHRSTRGSPFFTKSLSNEQKDKASQDTCDSPHDLSVQIPKTSSVCGIIDRVTNAKDVSDVSVGSLSKSLEQEMVKQAEIASTATVCFTSGENSTESDTRHQNVRDRKDQTLESNDLSSCSHEKETIFSHNDNDALEERCIRKTNATRVETIKQQKRKSPSPVLSVKRSSKLKRFSYPNAKHSRDFKTDYTNSNLIQKEKEPSENLLHKNESYKKNAKDNVSFKLLENTQKIVLTSENRVNLYQETEMPLETFEQTKDEKNVKSDEKCTDQKDKEVEFEQTDSENDILAEEVTDRTLMMVPESTTPACEQLFDMDALSQFPYEMSSPPVNRSNESRKLDQNGTSPGQNADIKLSKSWSEIQTVNNYGPMTGKSNVSAMADDSAASTNFEPHSTSGFKTASGKDVNISEEALKKAKAMFEMENQQSSAVSTNCKPSSMTGFKTASGKDVNISEEALKKAKAMFEMENQKPSLPSTNCTSFSTSGFKTASGKDVNISEEALKKAKAMFEMENQQPSADSANCTSSSMTGFKTASGKDVNISEEALKKAKAMFEMENQQPSAASSNCKPSSTPGFKTASGKDVTISEEALKKAKAMFEMENQQPSAVSSNCKPSSMTGFKTASGKGVTISEEALKKAKAMFEMENQKPCVPSTNCTSFSTSGFKTASGKDVNISEEALKKAKAMFEMENKQSSTVSTNCKPFSTSGFKTASGKDVNISEEALKKAKDMFEMENQQPSAASTDCKPFSMTGFKTASGKDVNISEEALKKAKVMFEMENQQPSAASTDCKPFSMTGFKTASGKDVNISEEALKKAKDMFEMENQQPSAASTDCKPFSMTGFKTASGKDVNISEEALKKAKDMFEMENQESSAGSVSCTSSSTSGFKTASGKDVNISEEALKKANAMFDTDNQELKHTSTKLSKTVCAEKNTCVKGAYQTLTDVKQDQEVPSESKAKLLNSSCQKAPIHVENTKTPSNSPATEIDDHLTREILESSAALLADESFTDLTDCLGHEEKTIPVPVRIPEKVERSSGGKVMRTPCHSEPYLKREALMSNARKRYKSFLMDEELANSPSIISRTSLKPSKPSPSSVLFDRRSKNSLAPAVVGPNMSTPLSRIPSSSIRNRQQFTRQASPSHPRVSSPSLPSPLATNNKQTQRSSPSIGPSSKKQFTTPFRSPSGSVPNTNLRETSDGSPNKKRARINGPDGYKNDYRTTENVKPVMGYLWNQYQSNKRLSLRQFVDNTLPHRYTMKQLQDLGVHDDVIAVTCGNAESFRFIGSNFFSEGICSSNQGVRMEDGGLLYIGQDGSIGLQEIEKAMLSTPGVDAKLLPEGWIANHYKWIVWKLACIETAFPQWLATKSLTPDRVLCQLKYRYDREIDRSHRSALKKILERDDIASRTMVLCVSSVKPSKPKDSTDGDQNAQSTAREGVDTVIQVTDGWYSINAVLDAPLNDLLTKRKIFVGLKLCINGAELIGSEQAVSPLEAPSTLMLRISANSTRRARWDARLGFQRYSHPFPLPLSSLFPNGGLVGCVDIVVRKRYPIEYMEKMTGGATVFRNARAEEREAKTFANNLERSREAVLARVQKDFESYENKPHCTKKSRRSYSPRDISKLRGGKELYDVCMSASDPSFIEECLDNKQRRTLEDYRRSIQDTRRAKLEKMFQEAWEEDENNISKRTVVPMLKVRIVNYLNCDMDKTEAILSVWRPTDDVIQSLTEGTRLRIYHVMASGSRYRQGLPSLQLSSTRNTCYKGMDSDPSVSEGLYTIRKITSFDDLQSGCFALYSEVDVVGCVVHVVSHNKRISKSARGLSREEIDSSLQTVYLTDDENNIIAVKFWGGLKVYAVDDLVKPRNIVACTNLVVRSNEHVNCPTLAFNELSTLTLKPREGYIKTALENLRHDIKDMNALISSSQRQLDQMRRRPVPSTTISNNSLLGNRTPQQDCSNKAESTKSTASGDKLAQKTPTMTNFIPKSGQCKRKLLDLIPEPPPSPSLSIPSTDNVRRDFKRPRRLTTADSTQKY